MGLLPVLSMDLQRLWDSSFLYRIDGRNCEKIEYNDITESFKGTPIVLVTACLMAIAFFDFQD